MRLSIPILAFALLTAGYLWPTEEAVSGLGLHLVALWLLLGILHESQCWWGEDKGTTLRLRFDAMDLGVLLIALGHVISTFIVFQVEGDRRAALNLSFEWIGLFVAWRIFRVIFQDRRIAAQGIAVVVALCVGLSCFGIWQHHVFYAEQSQWYRSLRSELDQALAHGDSSQFTRVHAITRELQQHDIPMSGPSRIAWENRLLNSSEPFATFSLANTLAGILATGLVLLVGQASLTNSGQHRTSWPDTVLLLIQICLITYCLVLTKSRSAWLGACVGICLLVIRRIRGTARQQLLRWGVAGCLIGATAVGTGVAVGALDKEVIFESTRSLQFRWYYWTGTLRMLREQPVTGAGPGNFRQVYLQYKSNETSEEIRDPHNFLLDAWSSSGLIGLSGIMLIIGCCVLRLKHRPVALEGHQSVAGQESSTIRRDRPLRIAATGILSGFLVHLVWAWLNGSEEWTLHPLLLTGGLVLLVARGRASFRPVDSTACLAAALAMMVNLLAAGGFEMPAVMITLLLCLAAGISVSAEPTHGRSHFRSVLRAVACLAALILVIKFGLMPVTAAHHHVQIGNFLLNSAQYPARALDQFQQAALADSQSPTPRQRIAEVLSYRLSEVVALPAAEMGVAETPTAAKNSHGKTGDETRKLVDQALQACEDLILADRRNSFSYRLRAEVRWNSGLLNEDHELRILAIQDLETANRLYPSSVDAWYRLAERLDSAGVEYVDAARTAAGRVLELETLNRAWGHADRFLTAEQLVIIKQIAGE